MNNLFTQQYFFLESSRQYTFNENDLGITVVNYYIYENSGKKIYHLQRILSAKYKNDACGSPTATAVLLHLENKSSHAANSNGKAARSAAATRLARVHHACERANTQSDK